MRRVARLGRGGFLLRRALRLRRSCTHTEPCCHEQRQGQVGRFWHSHRRLYWLSLNRSEEHTSELQSQSNLVCRLLLEKKKNSVLCMPRYAPTREAARGSCVVGLVCGT